MDTGADRPVAGLTLPATVDLGTASEDELLDLVEATARADARNAAVRAGALAGLHARVLRRVQQETSGLTAGPSHELEDLRLANRMVGGQVAHALGSSLWAADREVDRAVRLQVRPELGRVLAAGEVDVRQVDVLLEATGNLEPADADSLVCSLLSTTQVLAGDPSMAAVEPVRELASGRVRLWDLVPGRLRQITRREAARLDPASLTRRHALARAGRRAAHTDLPDAMAAIHLIGPAEAVNGAWANLDATARQAR